ncbi:MAG: 2-C-methyl-D-erythritol 4-phosphate cytidylyltransferase [Kiritimatiellae bacterium]|nr:2-C-methyl-D-erythritol 4-phosphate cytidylyltransferase [Kiritimatiellia bacterium]
MTIVVLIAGGTGARMGQNIPKQFLNVQDKPVIVYTMERFQRNPEIDGIVVVTLPNWTEFVWAYAKQFGISKLKSVVPGGAVGQESIKNGINAVAELECPPDTAVMIHDGIRPMIGDDVIAENLAVYRAKGNAVTCIPCVEVMYYSKDPAFSNKTVPRNELWRTQTPQTFSLEKLLWAHGEAAKRGITNATATCSLMTELGETVYFSKGSEKNVKLTTMDDIDIFKALLSAEKSAWDQRK